MDIQRITAQLKDKKKAIITIFGVVVLLTALVLILKPSSVEGFASGNGRIEATEIDISAKLAGRIIDIYVDEGDFVKKGEVLAQMQVDILEAQRDEAKAQYQQAVNAAHSIEAEIAVRKSDLLAAQSSVQGAESELTAAKLRFARSQTLAKEDAISKQVLDDDRAAVRTREAKLNAAKAQATAAQSVIKATQARLISAQSSIKAAAATVVRIETEIKDSQLKSPRNGRVQYRIAQPGEVVANGGKVLNLIDLTDVYMTFFLPEQEAGKVALGSEARIVLDAAPDYVIPAKISFVASQAQFTPKTVETRSERQKLMFRVKAKIDKTLLKKYIKQIKVGVPGVAWIKLDPQAKWPKQLALPKTP